MSCDNGLANEWARCSGKNASYITTFVVMHVSKHNDVENILFELINKNEEATKFGDTFNRVVTLRIRELTLPATIELCT